MKRRNFIGCCAALFAFPVKSALPTLTDRFCNYPVKLTEEIKIISAAVDTNFSLTNVFSSELVPYEDVDEVLEINVKLTYEDGSVRKFIGTECSFGYEKKWTSLEESTESFCRYDGKDIFITHLVDGCKSHLCTISNVTEVFDVDK